MVCGLLDGNFGSGVEKIMASRYAQDVGVVLSGIRKGEHYRPSLWRSVEMF